MSKYQFKILRESAGDSDEYEYHTHENVANGLVKIIESNDEGCVIGLQGEWGTGKSTVVSILKKKIEAASGAGPSNYRVFYFDAWAHEGDPLRQIFLQELIKAIDPDSLDKVNKLVSKKTKTIQTTVTRGTTLFGILFGLSTLLIPLGISVLRAVDFSLVSFDYNDGFYWELYLGLFLSTGPVFVTLAKLFKLHFWQEIPLKELKDNLHFLHKDGKETINQDIDEEYDRSSIDFQYYFDEIIKYYFCQDEHNRLIVVIDNLDRVDEQDALKIWSTLQTFLPTSSELKRNNNPGYRKIWTIIPYAERGIVKLWSDGQPNDPSGKQDAPKTSATDPSEPYKSFLEKSIQIRIDVPKPILTNWEQFAWKKAQDAFTNWPEDETASVIEILKYTRRSIVDCPTPRAIKSYINQVGSLRMVAANNIDTSTIAYYIAQKYLLGFDNETIIKTEILTEKTVQLSSLPSEYKKQLGSLIYGVSPDIAYQIMAAPYLEAALKKDDCSGLESLYKDTKSTFVSIFDYYLGQITELSELILFAFPLTRWEQFELIMPIYKKNLFRLAKQGRLAGNLTMENKRNYIAFFNWLQKEDERLNTKLLETVLQSFEKTVDSFVASAPIEEWVDTQLLIKETIQELIFNSEVAPVTFNWEVGNWIKWGDADFRSNAGMHKIIHPKQTLLEEISEKLKLKKPDEPRTELYFAVHYLIKSGVFQDWEAITRFFNDSLQSIDQNNADPEIYHSSILYDSLLQLKIGNWNADNDLESVIKSPAFIRGLPGYLNDGGDAWRVSLLMAMSGINVGPINVQSLLDAVWKTSNPLIAENMWAYIKGAPEKDFFWIIAEGRPDRPLIKDILLAALDDKEQHDLFAPSEPLARFRLALDYLIGPEVPDRKLADFVKRFVADSTIFAEIKSLPLFELLPSDREITTLMEHADMERVIDALGTPLQCKAKNVWIDLIRNHRNWSAILEKFVKYGKTLDEAFFEAILHHGEQWSLSGISNTYDLSPQYWGQIISLLPSPKLEAFKKHVSEKPFKNDFVLNVAFIKANASYFDKTSIEANLATNKNILTACLTDAIEEFGDFECLLTIWYTLKSVDKRRLRFNNDLTKRVAEQLQRLYAICYRVEHERILLIDLCSLFGLTLDQKEPPATITALTVDNLRSYVQHDPLCEKLRNDIKPLYTITETQNAPVFRDNGTDYPKLIAVLKRHGIETLEVLQREMLSHRKNMIRCFSKGSKGGRASIKFSIPIYVLDHYYRNCAHAQ